VSVVLVDDFGLFLFVSIYFFLSMLCLSMHVSLNVVWVFRKVLDMSCFSSIET
jgi:hypothetical protein